MRLQLLAHRDAVEPGHVDVEEDQIRLLGRNRIEGFDAIARLSYVVAELVKVSLKELAVRRDVIDDEDPRPHDGSDLVRHPAAARVVPPRRRTASRRSRGEIGFERKASKPAALVRSTSSGRNDALRATIGMRSPRPRKLRQNSRPFLFRSPMSKRIRSNRSDARRSPVGPSRSITISWPSLSSA